MGAGIVRTGSDPMLVAFLGFGVAIAIAAFEFFHRRNELGKLETSNDDFRLDGG